LILLVMVELMYFQIYLAAWTLALQVFYFLFHATTTHGTNAYIAFNYMLALGAVRG